MEKRLPEARMPRGAHAPQEEVSGLPLLPLPLVGPSGGVLQEPPHEGAAGRGATRGGGAPLGAPLLPVHQAVVPHQQLPLGRVPARQARFTHPSKGLPVSSAPTNSEGHPLTPLATERKLNTVTYDRQDQPSLVLLARKRTKSTKRNTVKRSNR